MTAPAETGLLNLKHQKDVTHYDGANQIVRASKWNYGKSKTL